MEETSQYIIQTKSVDHIAHTFGAITTINSCGARHSYPTQGRTGCALI